MVYVPPCTAGLDAEPRAGGVRGRGPHADRLRRQRERAAPAQPCPAVDRLTGVTIYRIAIWVVPILVLLVTKSVCDELRASERVFSSQGAGNGTSETPSTKGA